MIFGQYYCTIKCVNVESKLFCEFDTNVVGRFVDWKVLNLVILFMKVINLRDKISCEKWKILSCVLELMFFVIDIIMQLRPELIKN